MLISVVIPSHDRPALLQEAIASIQAQSHFSQKHAKGRLIDAIIRIREALLSLPEVSTSARRSRHVSLALARARFGKAYYAYTMHQDFPWRIFWASCAKGISWPQISLLLKAVARRITGVTPRRKDVDA